MKKIYFKLSKILILPLYYFNHRIYMFFYNSILKTVGVKLNGKPRYIGYNVKFDNFSKIIIGNRCVISDECHLLTHDYSLTTAMISINKKPKTDIAFVRQIEIGNNVFIGKKSIIMPGAKIGDNVIIGAGAVVRGKVPSNSIFIGNPAIKISDLDKKAVVWSNIETNIKKD